MPKTILHRDVTDRCVCCGMLDTFNFTNAHDVAQCRACKSHRFSATTIPKKQDDDHKARWRAKYDKDTTELNSTVNALKSEVAKQRAIIKDYEKQLDAKYEDLPPDVVERYYVNDLVREAHEDRAKAWYARDMAMLALTRIEGVHNPVISKDECSCGEPLDDCKVGLALEAQQPHLFQWQKKRREAGKLSDEDDPRL
ncbi:hypothetical protein [Demequina muriae]|uniref:Uncharacterized protein n=1 Tax=Demequina muriae TaxID=3051664 RepID=A0ABT8GF85_9MICO|nr:hypothetical protein [Demequina sp. EGI L300058]MDN4479611.1 hypothetical protein [Demequina sp. EGI L300058]